MSWWQSIILGLIQGLTEFLPVSSSGHLMIGREVLGIDAPENLAFEVALHAATVLATIIVFRRQICSLLKGVFRFELNEPTQYVLKIGISLVPVFVVGVFFKDVVEAAFSSLVVIGAALLVTAILLFLSDRVTNNGKGISWVQAFVIGIGQAVAVIPGLSRSGTTISTGLLCGVKREEVAEFSFLMVIIPILGEAFLDVVGGEFAAASIGTVPLVLGFLSAFLSGIFACKVMIGLVKRASLKWFALYCAVVGAAVLIFSL